MANTLKFGNGQWATKVGSTLAYNDEGGNFKPLPFNFTRSTGGTRVNKDGLIEVVTNNKPRIDFLNDSNGALLLEPTRTNSITYSNDFSQSIYGKNDLTITANQGISPDGTQNANLLVPNAAVGNRYLTNSTGSNLKINTVFLKKKELRYVKFGNAQSYVLVDLENGTISADSVSTNNFTIENYGNGWYRVSCYNTLDVNLQIQIFFGIDGSGSNIATNGTDGVYIYGFEIQNGSYATSYIPTQGAISTRVVEVCSQTPPSGIIGQTEGVMFVDFNFTGGYDTSGIIPIVIRSGTNSAYIFINVSGTLNCDFFDSNVLQARLTTNIGISGRKKIAFAYKQNDFVAYMNGVQIGTDTNGTVGAMGILNVGSYYTGGYSTIGGVNQSQLYNTRLSNEELAALTTI